MEFLILIPVFVLGGWWLYSMLLGGPDEAKRAFQADPGRGIIGIVFMGFIVLLGLFILGSIGGK